MFLPTTTGDSRNSIIAIIDEFIEPDTKLTLTELHNIFEKYREFEVRLGTDDWCIGEHKPIEHIYVDRVNKQLVLVCDAEL